MGQPYTTRFLVSSKAATRIIYTVPENMRAVIQTVMFNNQGTASAKAAYTHHGYQLVFPLIPVSDSVVYTDLRLALYERETCEIYLTASGLTGVVAGYLFADTGSGSPPPWTEAAITVERPTPQPFT
jgi:hypothetical protein